MSPTENSHKDGEDFVRSNYILNLSHRAENVQETQPVNLMNEWNAVWNAVMSVHKLLGNLYRGSAASPAICEQTSAVHAREKPTGSLHPVSSF